MLATLRLASSRFLSLGVRGVHGTAVARGGDVGTYQHKHSAHNNEETPFDFTEENYALVQKIITKYPPGYAKAATIPLLDLAQRQCGGWVPLAAMHKIAKILDVAKTEVYETCTFYTMFNREPMGKYHLQLCTTTPCMLRDSKAILMAIESHLGIHAGQTTPDGLFTLTEVECLGACVNAPMIQIGDHFYEDLTPETMVRVLEDLRKGVEPKVGVQSGLRRNCEPQGGLTSLKEPPSGPYCRELIPSSPPAPPAPPASSAAPAPPASSAPAPAAPAPPLASSAPAPASSAPPAGKKQ